MLVGATMEYELTFRLRGDSLCPHALDSTIDLISDLYCGVFLVWRIVFLFHRSVLSRHAF